MTESERDKRQLIQENAELQQRVEDMQSEFDFQRTQLNKEIESLGEQLDEVVKITQEKEEVIFLIENLVKDLENGNTSRVYELRQNVEELKRNIETRMKENSISRDRRHFTNSFEQESNFVVRSSSKEFQVVNNFTTDPQSPTPKASLSGSNGFYSMSQTNNILSESAKESELGQLTTTNEVVQ
jgi:hypothetical protein